MKTLQRAVDGTPAKRLLTSLVRVSLSDSLRSATPSLVLRAALSQAHSDLEATAQGPVGNSEKLGAEAKVRLLEMRESVHRSLIVKAKMLEKVGAVRPLLGKLSDEFSSEDYRDAANEWMGVTTEWIGLEAGESSGGGPRKVRSNRFLADAAAIISAVNPEAIQLASAPERAGPCKGRKAQSGTGPKSAPEAARFHGRGRTRTTSTLGAPKRAGGVGLPSGSWVCNKCWGTVQPEKGEVQQFCNLWYTSRRNAPGRSKLIFISGLCVRGSSRRVPAPTGSLTPKGRKPKQRRPSPLTQVGSARTGSAECKTFGAECASAARLGQRKRRQSRGRCQHGSARRRVVGL